MTIHYKHIKNGLARTIGPKAARRLRAFALELNVRSAYARERALELPRQTGMTTTEVVEDALRRSVPPGQPSPVGGLVRRGPILVLAGRDDLVITLNEANQAIEDTRNSDR